MLVGSYRVNGADHGFLWRKGGMIDIGVLGPGAPRTRSIIASRLLAAPSAPVSHVFYTCAILFSRVGLGGVDSSLNGYRESAGREPARHQLKLAGTRLLRQSKVDLQGVDH